MLRHRRFKPSGSTIRNKMIKPPNITNRRFGIIFKRSASEKISPPKDCSIQRVTIGSNVTKIAPNTEPSTEPRPPMITIAR